MPDLTVTHIALLAVALIVGVVVGWNFRGNKSNSEKSAINVTWQEQLQAQRQEHERLLDQNKSLMEQNSQYQASNRDSKMRASELSDALKEAFERRDELQRQIKDIRSNLESSVEERNQLQSEMENLGGGGDDTAELLQVRDETIARLSKELEGWQERVPPLVERFRVRNEEAQQLEQELAAARDQITALEDMLGSDQTRVEPVDPEALGETLDASNDPDDEKADPAEVEEVEFVADVEDVDESNQRDNLKKIKGVGPAIEKTLNEMGIVRFQQIADMSEYDIDRVAQRLKGFRSRIYREDWIGQARDHLDQKLNGSA
jgi:predicted flap endonuclease-1-like 5' DNA nuclease/regulator of replication initiation timing